MTVRETVVAPLGLVTRPNETGQYSAGALLTALNVCMRAPGIVEPLPARSQYAANGGGGDVVQRLWPNSESTVTVHTLAGLYRVTSSSRSAITVPSGWTLHANPRFMRFNQRDYVTTAGGPLGYRGNAALPVGIAQPASISCTSYTTASSDQALANNTNASYRAIIVRKTTTQTLFSAPSNVLNIDNTSGSTASPSIRVRFFTVGNYQVGDIVELYRTASQASGTSPGNRFRFCGSHTLDAGDITALSATIADNCTDSNLGTDLYTNPGQPTQGARHNRCPSYATDMATFKGYAFYATPYSHVRGVLKVRGRVGALGVTAPVRTHGIGTRTQIGDFTSGSPTVLNVGPITGIVVGQALSGYAGIPAGATVIAVSPTTITMSANATATNAAQSFLTHDFLDIGLGIGQELRFDALVTLAESLADEDVGIVMRTDASMGQILSGGSVSASEINDNVTLLFEDVYYAVAPAPASLAFSATNAANYDPQIDEMSASGSYAYPFVPKWSRVTVSKYDQPEHVPEENELTIGSGYVHRLVATKDSLFAFTSDGLYAIEGDAGVFRVRAVDQTLRLATRSSVDVMLDEVWAYTNRGLVVIGPSGVRREVSGAIIGDLIAGATITDETTDETTNQLNTFLTCDERNREVRLCIRSSGTSTIYLYNALTDKFTTVSDTGAGTEVVAECYVPFLESIVWSPSVAGASTPLYRYDTNGLTRTDDAIRFQPLYGTKEPFTLKQWSDFELLFRNVGSSSFTIDAKVNGSTAYSAVTGTVQNGLRRYVTGLPLNDAMAPSASFGFESNANGGSGWQLVGLSARWVPISQQVQK